MAIKKFEDDQIKMQGFEDYVKYVAYDNNGDIDMFDDPYQAEEVARESPSGKVDKIICDYNGKQIDSETWWDGYKVIAKQKYADYADGTDDCMYDDILIYMDAETFATGSGHDNKSCTKYADFANRYINDNDVWFNDTYDELDYVCDGLNEEFGGNWTWTTIKGSVQSEWAYIVYNKDEFYKDEIQRFANDYYGIGYDYACYIDGEYDVSVWVNEMDYDDTLDIIADSTGYNPDEIFIKEIGYVY